MEKIKNKKLLFFILFFLIFSINSTKAEESSCQAEYYDYETGLLLDENCNKFEWEEYPEGFTGYNDPNACGVKYYNIDTWKEVNPDCSEIELYESEETYIIPEDGQEDEIDSQTENITKEETSCTILYIDPVTNDTKDENCNKEPGYIYHEDTLDYNNPNACELRDANTWNLVDKNCNILTDVTQEIESIEESEDSVQENTTSDTETIEGFQELNTSDDKQDTTIQSVKDITKEVTGWDLEKQLEGIESKNELNPVSVKGETTSTSTISEEGELSPEDKLKQSKLKQAVIKGFFTINDEIIKVDPEIDSMNSILDKINASKAHISAKYNVDLDRVEITTEDLDSIIKLGNWNDTSNFLGAISLVPKTKIEKQKFLDVKPDHWSFLYVQTLQAMNIVKGKNESYFGSEDNISRIEALKVILESTKTKIRSENNYEFIDLPKSHWGYRYVSAAIDAGIIDNTRVFRPNIDITRIEMLEWMMKAKEIPIYTTNIMKPSFSDISSTNPKYYFIGNAENRGIINGFEDGTFGPDKPILRQEFSKIIFNILSLRI